MLLLDADPDGPGFVSIVFSIDTFTFSIRIIRPENRDVFGTKWYSLVHGPIPPFPPDSRSGVLSVTGGNPTEEA